MAVRLRWWCRRAAAGRLTEPVGLAAGLNAASAREYIQEHFEKIARTETNERHLFIPLHDSALPTDVALGLTFDGVS